MSHTIRFGTKAFDVNGCSMSYQTQSIRSESGRPVRWLVGFDVKGKMLGSGTADLTTKEAQMKEALQRPWQDITLTDDSTGAAAGISIFNNQTFSGIMITKGPTFADSGEPGEYVTFRTFEFSGEAQVIVEGQADAIISYAESVACQGNGGPVRRWRFPINAAPIRQRVTPGSIVRTIQSGRLVSHTRKPNPPEPFYGRNYLVNESEAVKYSSPKPVGGGWVEYGVEWQYIYETPFLPSGLPQLPRM